MSPETTITFHSRQRPPALKMSAQRVTVNYGPGHTPTLEMRFSALGIPSPFAVVNSTKLPPSAEWLRRPCSLAVSLPPVAPAAQVRPLTIAYRYSSGIHQYATAYPSTESVETVQTLDLRSLPPEIRCQGWQDSCLSPTAWRRQSSVDSSNMLLFSLASSKRTPSVFSINAQDLVGRQHLACEVRRLLNAFPYVFKLPDYTDDVPTEVPSPSTHQVHSHIQ